MLADVKLQVMLFFFSTELLAAYAALYCLAFRVLATTCLFLPICLLCLCGCYCLPALCATASWIVCTSCAVLGAVIVCVD